MKSCDIFDLSGKTALIAIPEGPYGKAAALALCEAGAAQVYLASDDTDAATRIADAIRKEGFKVTVITYDPAKEESINSLKDQIINESGKLDVLVLDAGERFTASWDAGTAEQLMNNLKKNQVGTMLITKIMGTAMAANKAGSIIFLSSVYAFVGPDIHNSENSPEMAASDFSLDRVFTVGGYVNYARQAASYLGQFNIRVNTICAAPLNKPAKYAEEFAKRTTLLRNANEDDVKGLVVYLASDASSYMSGISIPLDGGYTAK